MAILNIKPSLARNATTAFLGISALALAASAAAPAKAAIITNGLTLNFDAGQDAGGNNIWENTESLQTHNWQLGSNVILDSSPSSALPGITGSYVFPTSGTNSDDDKGIASSYQNIAGNPTNDAASFEIWFRPESLTNGSQVLWESGAGISGSSFTILNGDTLRFTIRDGADSLIAETPLTQSAEFIQAVATYSPESPGTLSLYINGELEGTDSNSGVLDWSGGAASGIGGHNTFTGGTGAGGVNLNFGTFEGEISIFRFYELALSGSEVTQNFDAIAASSASVPEPTASLGLFALISLGTTSIVAKKLKT